MAQRVNKYAGKFNAHVKAMQDARSSAAYTAPTTNSTSSLIDSLLNDERFNRPIAVQSQEELFNSKWAEIQAKIDENAGPSFGSRVMDVISRPSYATGNAIQQGALDLAAVLAKKTGTETEEQKALNNRSPLEALGDLGSQVWEGLSGKDKITPSGAIVESLNKTGTGRAVVAGLDNTNIVPGVSLGAAARLGIDVGADPLNLVGGGVIKNVAAGGKALLTGKGIEGVKAGLKATETAKATKDAATIAVTESRAVPRSVVREIQQAKTPTEVKAAVGRANAAVKSDAITRRFAEVEKANPEVVAPVRPTVEITEAKNVMSGIKAAAAHSVADGANSNGAQSALFGRIRNANASQAKREFGVPKTYTRDDFVANEAGRAVFDRTLSQVKQAEEAAEAKGIPHVITAGPGERRWGIKTSDIMEIIPAKGYNPAIITGLSGRAVPMSAIQAGVAKALDVSTAGLNKTDTLREIRTAMKKSGKPGSTSSMTTMANAIFEATPDFIARVGTNKARMGLKHDQDIELLTARINSDIQTALLGDYSTLVSTLTKATDNVAKEATAVGATTATRITAQANTAESVANAVDKADFVGAQATQRVVNARRNGQDVHEQVASSFRQQEKLAVDEARAAGIVDTAEAEYRIGLTAQMNFAAKTKIRTASDTKAMIELIRSQGVTGFAGHQIGEYNKLLNSVRSQGTENIMRAMSEIRQGCASQIPELDDAVRQVFDQNDALFGGLWKNGAAVHQINDALKDAFKGAKGGTPKFDEALAGGDVTALANQWRDFKMADPLDFLSRSYDALRKLAANQTAAISLETKFGSKSYRSGYVKIKSDADSKIATHLDPKMWYPRHVAEGIDFLEYAAGLPRSFAKEARQGKKLAIAIDKFYDPLLSAMKQYMTIVRPGHHIRNLTSEAMFSHLAGMNDVVGWNVKSVNVLTGKGGNYVQRVRLRNGQNYDITGDAMLLDFKRQGLLPNYHTTEDILTKEGYNQGRVDKLVNENRLVKAGGKVSEAVSAEARLAHYMWEMSRPENIKNAVDLPHLKAIAARNVRKWHPDASGLGAKEAKYARRIIPFYSWIRQAIPLVMEATVTRPGRVLAVPKANYALAQSNGVEPESLSEQFPENEIYPSYFTSNLLGPVGQDGTAFNFGSPAESVYGDIFNKIGNNPQSLAGDISPIVKTPIELMMSRRLDSGREIYDKGEYVDSAIPLYSNLASISGYSLTNSLATLVPGGAPPALDPQRAVELGNKQHWLNKNLVNFLTGIGVTNYGNESDRNNAIREMTGSK